MATTAGFTVAHADELERTGRWSLVRRSLGLESFGMNLVELEPGGQIPEHDETERDHDEVFVVLSGEAAIVVDGEEHRAPALTFARVDPERRRTVRNTGRDPVQLLIVSAPRSSGYEPMEWA
ncbi:MAG: cupin domain-containing protein [Gaiellaceae bacterium]